MIPDCTAPVPTPQPAAPAERHDGEGRAFEVRPYDAAFRQALDAFYLAFEPKRGAQGLPPQGADRIRRWLDSVLPQGQHLLAFREGRLIGHSLVVPTATEGTYEYAVFLDAPERGRGLGTELNRAAVEAARAAGVSRLWLSVEPYNRAAIRSYEKAGFRFLTGTVYSPEVEMVIEM